MSALTRRSLGGLMLGCLVPFGARAARTTASSTTKPVLTISGKIKAASGGDVVSFDMAALESIGIDGFETSTPWYTGPTRFDGVRMSRLLEHVGATGDKVTAVALNDYTTELPTSDFEQYGVILATKRDGSYMPVRDKGPLFIVYPYDSAPELKAQKYYNRSAWQVTRLVVS